MFIWAAALRLVEMGADGYGETSDHLLHGSLSQPNLFIPPMIQGVKDAEKNCGKDILGKP